MITEGMRCRHGKEGPNSRSKGRGEQEENRMEININTRTGDQSITGPGL